MGGKENIPMKSLETQIAEERENVRFFERINSELRTEIHRINSELRTEIHRLRLLFAQLKVEERIKDLPPEGKARLRAAFPGDYVCGINEAVNCEKRLLSKQDIRVEKILKGVSK
jgi:hypothetical protein